jgi:multiple sugar transport system substrate-binding protein
MDGGKTMKRLLLSTALAAAIALPTGAFAQDTTLRIFLGGQQRPDVMREILDVYQERNPGVAVEIEVGGATSEQQQQYLNTVLAARDSTLDVVLIDVIRPAQWAAAEWAEPLDEYLGDERDAIMDQYLPAYREANIVDGQVMALPYFADAQFLYYRTDLLEKHGVEPPTTWDELRDAAKTVLEGEGNPNLAGFETAGAPIEGTVCTYLVPLWGAGGELTRDGQLSLDGEDAARPFELWGELKDEGVIPANIAEIPTDRIRQDFQAGNLVFAMNWGYVWNRVQNDDDSQVKGNVGVVPLPGFTAENAATCIGGWQLAVTAFSENKEAAVDLIRFLSSPEVSKMQAIAASHMPVFPEVYVDSEVLEANPWFADALPVVETARARPVTPNYPRVSEVIRTNMNAFLAGTQDGEASLEAIRTGLAEVFR